MEWVAASVPAEPAKWTSAGQNGPEMQPPAPASMPPLELASLPQRHPFGDMLLHMFGLQTVFRLGTNPVKVLAGTLRRSVTVDLSSRSTSGTRSTTVREMGWNGLDCTEDRLARVGITVNENDITEAAAIGVMALLIHELEGVILHEVLQIGSGGDYAASLGKGGPTIQVEVSGIRDEPAAGACRSRLEQKLKQVLTRSSAGYASVTTFRWTGGATAHSYLHFTEKTKSTTGGPKPASRKGKKGRKR
jgi:hypothetical protein